MLVKEFALTWTNDGWRWWWWPLNVLGYEFFFYFVVICYTFCHERDYLCLFFIVIRQFLSVLCSIANDICFVSLHIIHITFISIPLRTILSFLFQSFGSCQVFKSHVITGKIHCLHILPFMESDIMLVMVVLCLPKVFHRIPLLFLGSKEMGLH